MKNITIGPEQLNFGFEPSSHGQDLQKVLVFIDSKIAEDDLVMLDRVANHFSTLPGRWPKVYIQDLVIELFKDDRIHFIIDSNKILPENIKTNLYEPAQSKISFLQTRKIISIIRTHISTTAQWEYIEIIKPEVVEKSTLLSAKDIGEVLFGGSVPFGQNSLCRFFRRHLRAWINGLEKYRKVADTGNYPGANEIKKGLDLSRKLLNIYDPFEFINGILNNKDSLQSVSYQLGILDNFYINQIYIWDALIKAVEDFKYNRTILEKDPAVKQALETLCKISKDVKPYSLIKEIRGLISIVKAAHDPFVEKQKAAAKAVVIEKVEEMIVKIVKILDRKKASGDIRNTALFPLQTIKRNIDAAPSIQKIDDYLNDAIDQSDYALDLIG